MSDSPHPASSAAESGAPAWGQWLQAAVASRLPVLPVLSSQLRETIAQVERGVVEVCGNFQRMAGRARDGVAAARAVVAGGGRDDAASVQSASALARRTLDQLLARLRGSSERTLQIVEQMEQLERNLEGVTKILDDVDRMARGTRLLGLNAAIEASRFGAEGKAFGIVAKEIEEMARHSSRTSAAIREAIRQLSGDVSHLSTEIRTLASRDSTEAEISRQEVDRAIGTLANAGERMAAGLVAVSDGTEELARDIAGAVMALQFQDAVSQRVGHVVDALGQMHRELSAATAGEGTNEASAAQAPPDGLLRTLEASYTMSAEREAQARACGTAANAAEAGSIELF